MHSVKLDFFKCNLLNRSTGLVVKSRDTLGEATSLNPIRYKIKFFVNYKIFR